MISAIQNLDNADLEIAIKHINNQFCRNGFMPVRWSYTELKRYAQFLERADSGEWDNDYYQSVIAPFNRLELDLIKEISKAGSRIEQQAIQGKCKIYNQATRREVNKALGKNNKQRKRGWFK